MEPNFLQPKQQPAAPVLPEEKLRKALNHIAEARIKEDRLAEQKAYQEANIVFKEITGEDLFKKANDLALSEIDSEGFKIIPKQIVAPEDKTEGEVLKFKVDQQPFGLQRGWMLLSEEEKKYYENDYNIFVGAVEDARQKLEKKGIPVSREVFYNMVGSGYMFSDLRKNFFSGKIKLPVIVGEGVYKFNSMTEKQFDNLVSLLQGFMDLIARKAVEDQMRKKIIYKKKRWHERKMRKIRELLLAKINEIEGNKKVEEIIRERVQQQLEIERKKFEQKNLHISESAAISKFKALEKQEQKAEKELDKQLHRMEKRVERDIQETKKSTEEISHLEKDHKKAVKITQNKNAYKKAIEQNKNL